MSDDTIRQGILDDLTVAIYACEGINGVIDDMPPVDAAEPPPRPRPGLGEARRPFAWVVDGPESMSDETTNLYEPTLPIEIIVLFDYSRADAERTCKRLGRQLLGRVQAAIMVDPNRGLYIDADSYEAKRASNTIEDSNEVGEAVPEKCIGAAIWRGRVLYTRARQNPASRIAA